MEEVELAGIRQQVGLLLAKMHSGSEQEMDAASSKLAFMASKPKMHTSLLRVGVMNAVNELLMRESEVVKASCASIIGSLASTPENKMVVFVSGSGSALIALLKQDITQNTKSIAAKALYNISNLKESRIPLLQEGILPVLLDVIATDVNTTGRTALCALNNIACEPANKANIVDAGVVNILTPLLAHPSHHIRNCVLDIIANLSAENHLAATMAGRREWFLPLVVAFLSALQGQSNMSQVSLSDGHTPAAASETQTSTSLVEPVPIPSPTPVPTGVDTVTITADVPPSPPTTDAALRNDAAVTLSASPLPPKDHDMNSLFSHTPTSNDDTLCWTVTAKTATLVAVLTAHTTSHEVIQHEQEKDGGVDMIPVLARIINAWSAERMHEKDTAILEFCVVILANLSSITTMHESIMASGAIEPLVDMLSSPRCLPSIQQAAYTILSRLGVFDIIQQEDTRPVITASVLASLPTDAARKQMIGDQLYELVAKKYPEEAPSLTGMLLQTDNSELLRMLHSPGHLNRHLEGAQNALVAIRKEQKRRLVAQQHSGANAST